MSVLVIVPAHGDELWRERARTFVLARLAALHGDWPLALADQPEEGWSKSRAVNEIAREYDATEALVVCDADVVIAPDALRQAVQAVEEGAPWAVPHGTVYRLTPSATRTITAGPVDVDPQPMPTEGREPYEGLPGGGLFVCSRWAWSMVGGFDERFTGWGSEDVSLGYALDTLAGPHWRGSAPLWHLWHPPADRGAELYANQRLEGWYRVAYGRPERMRRIIPEPVSARESHRCDLLT